MKIWSSKWIGYPGISLVDWRRNAVPAPEFRCCFALDRRVAEAELFICGLGYFEFRLDGEKVCDDLLVPAPTQYDRRWRYRRYNLGALGAGPHVLAVTLGNGLYNCMTPEVWHFDKADWRDYPKLICQLEENGRVLAASGSGWIVCPGPILFDSLRGGEVYDARRELPFSAAAPPAERAPGIAEIWPPDQPPHEQKWRYAAVVPPPGGIGEEERFPPCRVARTVPMRPMAEEGLYEAPFNLAGVVRLRVEGEAGARVVLRHGERLTPDGKHIDDREFRCLVLDDTLQRDEYILKGGGTECWQPRFTFHGFRYVETECVGRVRILSLEALVIHTDFERHGEISSSDSRLTALEQMARNSCESNFVGMPLDCPHREKNGWTSESQLMLELFLYTWDAACGYEAFADLIADAQRLSGQLPGMVPSAGWGYNWGSGTPWDSALFTIPYTVWLFTGRSECIGRNYPAMCRYLAYCESIAEDGVIRLGLADWLPPEGAGTVEAGFVQTAYYVHILDLAAACAEVLEKPEEARRWRARAQQARAGFNRAYYLGGGVYRGTRSTVPALALQFRLVPEPDRERCVQWLAEIVSGNGCRVDYGTIGSRQVPRALFENGPTELAFRLMTQPECPGYLYWHETLHLTGFPEWWDAAAGGSLNHGAFSDIAGCMYRYLGGFRHSVRRPGPSFLEIRPAVPAGLPDFTACYRGFRSCWKREKEWIRFEFSVPAGAEAQLFLPDGRTALLRAGNHRFQVRK